MPAQFHANRHLKLEAMKPEALQELYEQAWLSLYAAETGVVISDSDVDTIVTKVKASQANKESFNQLLAQRGLTEKSYARMAREFSEGGEIPAAYWRLGRLWMMGGLLATLLPLFSVVLMVFKPT